MARRFATRIGAFFFRGDARCESKRLTKNNFHSAHAIRAANRCAENGYFQNILVRFARIASNLRFAIFGAPKRDSQGRGSLSKSKTQSAAKRRCTQLHTASLLCSDGPGSFGSFDGAPGSTIQHAQAAKIITSPEFTHARRQSLVLSGSHRSTQIASDLASRTLASQAKPQRESESQAFRIARS